MDKNLQYAAMEKIINSMVKPEFDKIIEKVRVVPPREEQHPTVKIYLTPNLLHFVSVENSSGIEFEHIEDLTDAIDWKVTDALKYVGSPRYWIEFIQIQP
jgi:hypothetical protein